MKNLLRLIWALEALAFLIGVVALSKGYHNPLHTPLEIWWVLGIVVVDTGLAMLLAMPGPLPRHCSLAEVIRIRSREILSYFPL